VNQVVSAAGRAQIVRWLLENKNYLDIVKLYKERFNIDITVGDVRHIEAEELDKVRKLYDKGAWFLEDVEECYNMKRFNNRLRCAYYLIATGEDTETKMKTLAEVANKSVIDTTRIIAEEIAKGNKQAGSVINNIEDTIKGFLDDPLGAIDDLRKRIENIIKGFLNDPIKSVQGIISDIVGTIKGALKDPINTIRNIAGGIVESIKNALSKGLEIAGDITSKIIHNIKGSIDMIVKIPSNISSMIEGILKSLSNINLTNLISSVTNLTTAIKTNIKNIIGTITELVEKAEKLIGKILSMKFDELIGKFADVFFKTLIQTFFEVVE